MTSANLFFALEQTIQKVLQEKVSQERKHILAPLIDAIQHKVGEGQPAHLNFICTHNSRRSQLAQVWSQVASTYYEVSSQSYSGGVEVTEFNARAVASLRRAGFLISDGGGKNPNYRVAYRAGHAPILAFSKLYNDITSPNEDFVAVMTCAHADEHCPFVAGAAQRIPVRYEDPKAFDNTASEVEKYDERSIQIASEMFYVFSHIN